MTNEEKYKTLEERNVAFTEFCDGHTCDKCQCDALDGDCHFAWLSLEVKENPSNCPFCDGGADVVVNDGPTMTMGVCVKCKSCGASSMTFNTREAAIAAWNRRVE